MNAVNDTASDQTTPLVAPGVLVWFDDYFAGACTSGELSDAVCVLCHGDPIAAHETLALLEHYAAAGQLQLREFEDLLSMLRLSAAGTGVPAEHTVALGSLQPPPPVASFPGVREAAAHTEVAWGSPAALPPSRRNDAARRRKIGAGTVLRGRYVLEDELGIGGMGTVYRALDRNRAGLPERERHVAIKVLRDEFAHLPDSLQTLRKEFYQAQSLSHPGIVNVFDFDQDGDVCFVTMELLDGEPLSELMRRIRPHKLARDPARRILRQLGLAMSHAHERGVLHLDLKPGNVMVTPQGNVRVLDFGLAQSRSDEPWISDSEPLLHAATPAYASCERLSGELPDVRDDVYSYACLAYELLSGRHPFDRRSALEARSGNLRPPRIGGLPGRQWTALRQGLALSRRDRTDDLDTLLAGLDLTTGDATDGPGLTGRTTGHRGLLMNPRDTGGQARSMVGWIVTTGLIAAGLALYFGWERVPPDLRRSVYETATGALDTVGKSTSAAAGWLGARTEALVDRFGADRGSDPDVAAPLAPAAEPSPTASDPAVPPESRATGAPDDLPSSSPTVPEEIPLASLPTAGEASLTAAAPAPPVTEPASAGHETGERAAATPTPPPVPARPGTIEFRTEAYQVGESDSTAKITVVRRGGASGEIGFSWHTEPGSATADEDYAASGTVTQTMRAGQTTTNIVVPIVSDGLREHAELFDVVITDATQGAGLGTITRAAVVIVDDD